MSKKKIEPDTRIVFPEAGRTDDYQIWLRRILESGNCPFCEEHWPGEHKLPYEIKKYWILTDNAVKSDQVDHHWLMICRRHLNNAGELNSDEFAELQEIYKYLMEKHNLGYLTFIMRSGSPHTGSSVSHLHAQIFVSKPGEAQLTRV